MPPTDRKFLDCPLRVDPDASSWLAFPCGLQNIAEFIGQTDVTAVSLGIYASFASRSRSSCDPRAMARITRLSMSDFITLPVE